MDVSIVKLYCRYWADENPHWLTDSHMQYSHKINIWVEIIGHHVVENRFFINGNLNSEIYLYFLRIKVVAAIQNIVREALESLNI